MCVFLCLGCVSLVYGDHDHVCRVPYPKSSFAPGAARIGVLSFACVGKLWLRGWWVACAASASVDSG